VSRRFTADRNVCKGPGSFLRVTSRRRRLLVTFLASTIVVIAAAGWLFVELGQLLHEEDPLQRADAVFALGGSRLMRAAEAGELVLAGWAPRVLLSLESEDDRTDRLLRARGITVMSETDLQRDALRQLGVDDAAIEVLAVPQVTTGTEAQTLLNLARQRAWTRVIVVTSKLHTGRARLVMRRRFAGSGVEVIVRASRYDSADVDRWWRSPEDRRFAVFEAQKWIAYAVGAAD
jgi:uncharacterized SAM-binding protein YcdF (DUF218 family)